MPYLSPVACGARHATPGPARCEPVRYPGVDGGRRRGPGTSPRPVVQSSRPGPPHQTMLRFDDIQAAAARLKGIAHRTPVLHSRTLDALLGCQVLMKAENLQRMGAFKFRGGYNAVNVLSDAQRARGVVAFSSGNHAQAVALAAQLHGCQATIVMPHDAPALKLAATRGYGAEV